MSGRWRWETGAACRSEKLPSVHSGRHRLLCLTAPTKQVKPVYQHAPWLNDPYDTLYSFAMFLVPLATAFSPRPGIAGPEGRDASGATGALRPGQLGRRHRHDRPLVSCWIGVATGANKAQWNGTTTVALVAGLAIVTALDVRAVVMLVRALRLGRPDASHSEAVDDWLGDAILVARRESRRFGPFRPHVTSVVAWCDRTVIARLRRHPILGAALASVVFGTGVGLNQGIREGYLLASTLPTVGLLTCGMFDFLMLAGSYLVVVCSGSPLACQTR